MFKLSRYFSIASLIGIVAVVALLATLYRSIAFDALLEHETRANVALTRAFANSIWPRYAGFIKNASDMPPGVLARSPVIAQLRAETLRQMKGLSVAKIRIYTTDGITAFSTVPEEIGKRKTDNRGFRGAMGGRTRSEIVFRNEFYAMEQMTSDRNLVSSYIPIRSDENAPIEAIFELYSDVTDLVDQLENTVRDIVVATVLSLSALYLFLFVIVKRADTVIQRQEQERQEQEARVRHQAYHDALTGLPNRTGFAQRIEETIKRARRVGGLIGLMFVDLDRFKDVNDQLGHPVGDELLRAAASRIAACTRESDMLFRMSGDEFTVILEHLHTADDAARVAGRIVDVTAAPFEIEGHTVSVSASIGISIVPAVNADAETLLKRADIAMYQAKAMGRNRYAFFPPDATDTLMPQ